MTDPAAFRVQTQQLNVNLNPTTRQEGELAASAKQTLEAGQGAAGGTAARKDSGSGAQAPEPADGDAEAEQDDSEHTSSNSEADRDEDEAGDGGWKNYPHAAATHNPLVMQHMNRENLFQWWIIDISHISPMSKYDELWLPTLNR